MIGRSVPTPQRERNGRTGPFISCTYMYITLRIHLLRVRRHCRCADGCADVQMCRCADVQMCRCARTTVTPSSSCTADGVPVFYRFTLHHFSENGLSSTGGRTKRLEVFLDRLWQRPRSVFLCFLNRQKSDFKRRALKHDPLFPKALNSQCSIMKLPRGQRLLPFRSHRDDGCEFLIGGAPHGNSGGV